MSLARVAFIVSVDHAVTEARLVPQSAMLTSAGRGWQVLSRDGTQLVCLAEGFTPDEVRPPTLWMQFEPALAHVLRLPRPTSGVADSIEVPLPELEPGAAGSLHPRTISIPAPPGDLTLEVALVNEHGEPSLRRQVEAVSSAHGDATVIPLAELASRSRHAPPGLYQSVARVWGRSFYPFSLHVDGRPIGRSGIRHMNYTTTVTRHRVVAREVSQQGLLP